jgi:hypothetical protein
VRVLFQEILVKPVWDNQGSTGWVLYLPISFILSCETRRNGAQDNRKAEHFVVAGVTDRYDPGNVYSMTLVMEPSYHHQYREELAYGMIQP